MSCASCGRFAAMPRAHDHEQSDDARLPGEPRVSVLIITYNQEDLIAEAITSALRQEAPFDYEIVVGEDCSTDRTRDICAQIQRRFPGKIRLLWSDRNL